MSAGAASTEALKACVGSTRNLLLVISTASHELAKWLKRTYLKEAMPIYSPRLFGHNHFLFSMFIQCECASLQPLRALLRETKIGPDHTAGYSWGGTWPGG